MAHDIINPLIFRHRKGPACAIECRRRTTPAVANYAHARQLHLLGGVNFEGLPHGPCFRGESSFELRGLMVYTAVEGGSCREEIFKNAFSQYFQSPRGIIKI